MPLCTDRTLVNANSAQGEISALKCKRWSCEICNPDNRWKVICKAKAGNPNIFLTLTCLPDRFDTPDEAARDMKRGLVLFRRMIARRWGVENIPFIVVFERHKSGWPHMHLLLRGSYMHWQVLRGMWKAITGAYQVDVRHIRTKANAAYYVAKYLGKDLAAFKGCKRWWRSQNYNVDVDDRKPLHLFGERFVIEQISYFNMLNQYQLRGWNIEQIGRYRARVSVPDDPLTRIKTTMPWWHVRYQWQPPIAVAG